LLLHAPTGSDPDAIASWAWSIRGWVFRRLAGKHLLLPASPAKDFVTGDGFDYLGRHYRLQLTGEPPGGVVKLERGRFRMPRHTPAFWATVQRALSDHDRRRTRLAAAGTTLWLG